MEAIEGGSTGRGKMTTKEVKAKHLACEEIVNVGDAVFAEEGNAATRGEYLVVYGAR
jgi:hypothetical protein